MDPDVRTKPNRKANPYASAGLLSRLTFWWLGSTLRSGLHRPLDERDIFECLPEHRSTKLTNCLDAVWKDEQLRSPTKPRLLRAILRIYAKKFLFRGVLLNTLDITVKILQPQCLGGLVMYFSPGEHHITIADARLYAVTIVAGSALVAVFYHSMMTYCTQIGMRIRHSCVSLIYRKMLRLSKSMAVDGLNGRVINLMANDVARFDLVVAYADVLWKGPLMLVLMSYFIYLEIGWFGFLGIGMLLGMLPLLMWMGKLTAGFRTRTAIQTGRRVRFMNEILQAMQVIKMYTWERPFAAIVDKIRKKELKSVRGALFIRGILFMNRIFANISIFISLIAYVYFGNAFSARKVYIVTAYMQFLYTWMVYFWSMSIQLSAEALVSVGRIEEFLLLPESKASAAALGSSSNLKKALSKPGLEVLHSKEEVDTLIVPADRNLNRYIVYERSDKMVPRVQFRNATASWIREDNKGSNVGISNVDLELETGKLCAIIGSVGSGKSTLLQVILHELELDLGSVSITGALSYAAQEPWLFEGSIRQNIVFVEEFDEARYWEVVRVCALERDFELLPFGDDTIVGERGNSLSGGQRARVNLARAVYKRADIYLLDDPLSAVDSRVGKHIFEQCVSEFLKDKVCVLVTHQLQFLKSVDHLVLMNSGQIQAQGSFAELRDSQKHSLLIGMDDDNNNENDIEEEVVQKTESSLNKSRDTDEKQCDNKEAQSIGAKGLGLYRPYFSAVNNVCFVVWVFSLLLIAQGLMTFVDIFISQWSTWEDTVQAARVERLNIESHTNGSSSSFEQEVLDERFRHVMIYVAGTVSVVGMVIMRNFSIFQMCLMASRHLHDRMFRGITRAWMSFFNANPSGRILNRFSKDIDTIDTLLPVCLFETMTLGIEIVAILLLVSMWNVWMLIPSAALVIVFFLLRRVYLGTSRPVKRIEALSRSPVFAHTNATLQGLTTIRALNAEKVLSDELDAHLDFSSSANYMFVSTTRAFGLWVELTCCVYIGSVMYFFLVFGTENIGSKIGLAITQMFTMTSICQWTLRQQTEVENQMVSVQRVDEYAHIDSEPPLESDPKHRPKSSWPSSGSIHFRSLSMSYTSSGPDVLRNLDLQIEPREKIGIVGRTGAGKSSIIQALFRLAHNRGTIQIDGIDIGELGLHDLRSRVSIIPQDPVLFSGSMRHNLDPFAESDDEAVWKALALVELKDVVAGMPGGLDGRMADGGSNFSLGQRQLVCLARAILRRNRILVLDEATANVDADTDRLIQKSIREQFEHCTVLTVAHRLHTVMDSDRVLVMDDGRAVEFDHPALLLRNSNGHLSELVRQTGRESEIVLRQLAEESFTSYCRK